MQPVKETKSYKKQFLTFIVLFAILFVAIFSFLDANEYVSSANVKGFYQEPKDSIDVVMIGSSEIYYGYAPPVAWKKYGYTSYNLATAGAAGSLYKSMVKEAVRTQHPKLVVIEVSGFTWGDHRFAETPQYHNWLDNMPWGTNKMEALRELLPAQQRMQYYFPILTYHQMWKRMGQVFGTSSVKLWLDINGHSNTKGFKCVSVKQAKKHSLLKKKKHPPQELTPLGEKYLRELLETCRKEGIENVLLTRFPMKKKMAGPQVFAKIDGIAKEYGYSFLNMDKSFQEIGLSTKHDYVDSEHLNVMGLEKFTDYLGNYITTHYNVKRSYTAKETKMWNQCALKSQKMIDHCKKDYQSGKRRVYYELSTVLFPHPAKQKRGMTK